MKLIKNLWLYEKTYKFILFFNIIMISIINNIIIIINNISVIILWLKHEKKDISIQLPFCMSIKICYRYIFHSYSQWQFNKTTTKEKNNSYKKRELRYKYVTGLEWMKGLKVKLTTTAATKKKGQRCESF